MSQTRKAVSTATHLGIERVKCPDGQGTNELPRKSLKSQSLVKFIHSDVPPCAAGPGLKIILSQAQTDKGLSPS